MDISILPSSSTTARIPRTSARDRPLSRGVHHIGFYVDDLEEACATIEAANATLCPGSSVPNRKYKGPDGLMIDLRARGWDEQIKARMPLYQLTPAPTESR
mgnify:CR=1 FL=1